MEEDIYSGYDNESSPLGHDLGGSPNFGGGAGALQRTGTAQRMGTGMRMGTAQRKGTAMGRGPLAGPPGTAFGPPGTSMRMATGAGGGEDGARPMTAVKGAGYVSSKSPPSRGAPGGTLSKAREPSAAEMCKRIECRVHEYMEEAATCLEESRFNDAHDKARAAKAKSDELQSLYAKNGWSEAVNVDLQFAVQICLAHCSQAAGLDQEALTIYRDLVKNEEYTMPGRLRVNMGNIYVKRRQWTEAIKQYRMALDQIPNERTADGKDARSPNASLQSKLLRNIGIAFLNQGMYQDARDNFEAVLHILPDHSCAFNRLVCSYMITSSVEQAEALKTAFRDLLKVPGTAELTSPDDDGNDDSGGGLGDDGLQDVVRERARSVREYVVTAAKLVAPRIHHGNAEAGFQWCLDELARARLPKLAHDVLMAKAAHFMAAGETESAIEVLKQFEKHSDATRVKAATNLSFLYLLEGRLDEAERFAKTAKENDEYHAQALVNLGNVEFERAMATEDESAREDHLTEAKALYDTAAHTEPDCVEAIYNMGLAAKASKQYDLALEQFILLNGLLPNEVEVLYQIAEIYYLKNDKKRALKMLHLTYDFVGSEAGILAAIGRIHAERGERDEALHFMLDSYEQFPDLDVLSSICAQYVNDERYETAASYFQAAAKMQPGEAKWHLMVASCHRRANKLEVALKLYEQIHERFPDNMEALKFLVQLSSELQDQTKRAEYEAKLQKLERVLAMQENVPKANHRPAERDAVSMLGASGAYAAPAASGSPPATHAGGRGLNGGGGDDLGDDDLLPETMSFQAPASEARLVQATGRRADQDWDQEELGADLLPGLD